MTPSPRNDDTSKATSDKAKDRLGNYWSLLGFDHWSTERLDRKTGVPYYGMTTKLKGYPSARTVVPHSFDEVVEDKAEGSRQLASADISNVADSPNEIQGNVTRRAVRKVNIKGLLGGETSFEALTGCVDLGYPRGYLSLTVNKRKFYLGWAEKVSLTGRERLSRH